MPLEGCPPQPGAPAVAGTARRALEGQGHDDGALGDDGRRHTDGVPDVPARISRRRHRPVHEPDGARRDRQQAGVRDRDHPGARRGAPADGQVDRLHVRRLRLPDRRARGDDPARGAVRRLSRRARDPHGPPRGRARDRATVRRRARELRAHAEPPRLLARAAAPQLPLVGARRRQHGLRRREDLRHLRRLRRRRLVPDEVERRRHQPHDRAARERRRRARLREPRRDGHALGTPQRPGELPPLPAGLRPPPAGHPRGAATGRPPHHHVRSRLRPDDRVDRPLARARAPARVRGRAQRRGADPRGGRVRGRGRDGERLARRQVSGEAPPGRVIEL